jgi:membrane protein DedA with SNARE-associated domain
MEAFISTYGYAAVLVGAFFEGETVVLLAGVAAHLGYLELPWVIFSAAAGATAGDQTYFYLGRIKGMDLLVRHPRWGDKAQRVLDLIGRNENLVMVAFRFLYGLRMITPVMLALSGVRPAKFLAFDVGGTVVWAIIFATIGYFSGQALEMILGDIQRIEIVLLVALVVLGTIAAIVHWWLRWRRDRS